MSRVAARTSVSSIEGRMADIFFFVSLFPSLHKCQETVENGKGCDLIGY